MLETPSSPEFEETLADTRQVVNTLKGWVNKWVLDRGVLKASPSQMEEFESLMDELIEYLHKVQE